MNFTFEEVRKNSVICKWNPPLDDGGSEILNYTLEKKDNSKLEIGWSSVTSTLRGCRYLVPKLLEKKEYIFRVLAENKFGAGPYCVSKPLIAKNPFGKGLFIITPIHVNSKAILWVEFINFNINNIKVKQKKRGSSAGYVLTHTRVGSYLSLHIFFIVHKGFTR